MKYLSKNFNVLTLEEFCSEDRVSQSERSVVVTFDDGLLDNYKEAYPILQDLDLSATFFISTGLIGQQMETHSGSLDMMDSKQIVELSENGHEIGSHGSSHRKLTSLSSNVLDEEIIPSKKGLEEMLGKPVTSFAYPHGNYDQSIIERVKKAGFDWAVTTEENLVDRQNDSPYELPRRIIHKRLGTSGFYAKLTRSYDYYQTVESCLGMD